MRKLQLTTGALTARYNEGNVARMAEPQATARVERQIFCIYTSRGKINRSEAKRAKRR